MTLTLTNSKVKKNIDISKSVQQQVTTPQPTQRPNTIIDLSCGFIIPMVLLLQFANKNKRTSVYVLFISNDFQYKFYIQPS